MGGVGGKNAGQGVENMWRGVLVVWWQLVLRRGKWCCDVGGLE